MNQWIPVPSITKNSTMPMALALVALVLAGVALLRPVQVALPEASQVATDKTSPLLAALDRGTIVVGYGGYPPYTIEDPATGNVSGLSVDLVNEIAAELHVKVTWKRFNWNTMTADLKRGQIDLIADPIFETIPRGRELTFSQPYAFVPTGIGLVRTDGRRFGSLNDLNSPDVRVAVGQGFAEETLLRNRVPKADIIAVPANDDTAAAANLVLSGRADIAIVTLSDANRFMAANLGRLQVLWADKPPAYMPAGFALRFGDQQGAAFLNVAINNLRYTGYISSLASKYQIVDDFRIQPNGL